MIVSQDILELIGRSVPDCPPESGGILGSRDREVIDNVVFDIPSRESSVGCVYSPDVNFLNDRIKQWQREGIAFMGLFHTHFYGVRTLSCADKYYICTIMNAMPAGIEHLYFPVYVLPEREFSCYIAIRKAEGIDIHQELLYIKK